MRNQVVAVRCFAEETAGRWEAHCVDLDLTVEGDSLEAVKSELDHLIHEHIDGIATRRTRGREAPARSTMVLRLRYWGLYLAGRLGLRDDALRRAPPPCRYRPQMAPRLLR